MFLSNEGQAQAFKNKFLPSSGLLAVLAEPCPQQQTANVSRIIQTSKGSCSVVGVLVHRAEIVDWS